MTSTDRQAAPVLPASAAELFADIALAAGAVILDIYGGEFDVTLKADASPFTKADIAAEALILARLSAAFPAVPVIAEEAVANGIVPEFAERFILVDPLDGSREFIARNGEFTVNIALIEHGVPIAGAVYAPALGRIWWGSAAGGAFAASVAEGRIAAPTPITIRPAPSGGLTLVGSRSHKGGEAETPMTGVVVAQFTPIGSSLKFCLVAEGTADLYPRFNRTMEWDTAAGDAILRAAGGAVVSADGAPLLYGKCNRSGETDFANTRFWAVGDRALTATLCGDPAPPIPDKG
ncbi:MAG TPA: 3'(2'),5'-bisphosphate nucleotidase CysQ [Pelagibacterium sp.]|uniref:3'(2'),5'-bisphosphate nucleotidase CysQ n=1 Tax=Pelagibacterium sp. TaxID=1967288 RepID=UPI002C809936|nr:3'(2'),5'-bisphosphate nucleotidase CysQ [Pelagibacterium sp.]HWJ86732.1 3'(2'),5'-bisphosphate nucleotidase CysQ [Pelagibacterium sp.]